MQRCLYVEQYMSEQFWSVSAVTWAAQYNSWPLVELTLKGVVFTFSFLFFSFWSGTAWAEPCVWSQVRPVPAVPEDIQQQYDAMQHCLYVEHHMPEYFWSATA